MPTLPGLRYLRRLACSARGEDNSVELAMALNNLANVFSDRGAYDDALVHYQQALDISAKQRKT